MSSRAPEPDSPTTIGVISDTHGVLRPEAFTALTGSHLIIHAGDIGKPEVLTQLETLAPVLAVKGNNDQGSWADSLPETQSTTIQSHHIFVIHDVKRFKNDPIHSPFTIIISGHSHKPTVTEHNGLLFLNPGSAGPRRFSLPITVALIHIDGLTLSHQFIHLTQ
ncbi:MAG: metallophosphoesterase family protein [Nitrospirae bacterium]|nr:metallophosphoesterase family protein [Nitrospirota bacterium]MDA1303114.1 metallophosphoesterase family protein [Nitrospirota bacterium]